MSCRTLLVEDDPHVADVVAFLLEELGHRVVRAADGTQGWLAYGRQVFGLVVLDLGLPGLTGNEVFRRIRQRHPKQPIIMLTARSEEAERVQGLQLGADDYITKPFSNPEFQARVRNLLRRCPPGPDPLPILGMVLKPDALEVQIQDQTVRLPAPAFRLLEVMLRNPEWIFSRDQLLDLLYGKGTGVTDRAVDQTVARLRRTLRGVLRDQEVVESVYGLGYRLNPALLVQAS